MSMVKRNSSLELLRILSMVMILAHHYVIQNGYSIELIPFGINRFLLQILLLGGGTGWCCHLPVNLNMVFLR